VRHLAAVEHHAVLELAGVPEDAVVADDHVFPNVAARADLAVSPDPCWAFDHCPRFQRGAFINEDILRDEGSLRHLHAHFALQPEIQILLDPRQRRPHGRVIREKDAMLRVFQIKVVAGREHVAEVSGYRFKVSSFQWAFV